MTELDPDVRLICLAALAWLHEHDTVNPLAPTWHADMLDAQIDKDELARALDRLTITDA